MNMRKCKQRALSGYPWKDKFQTLQKIEEYFDQDRLTCLLCGRTYISLHKHLLFTHKVQADDYKETYGIPWVRGLISRTLRKRQAAIMNQQRKEGILPKAPSKEHLKKLTKVCVKNRRPITDAARNHYKAHALRTYGRTEKWGEKILKNISGG